MQPAFIDRLSLCPLHLTFIGDGGATLGSGTGFAVERAQGRLLFSARHCFTGRNHDTNEPLHPSQAVPSRVVVRHHYSEPGLGMLMELQLRDDHGDPLWLEYPEAWGCMLDIAAMPLPEIDREITIPVALDDLKLTFRVPLPVEMESQTLRLLPAEQISVIGYPLGMSTHGALPIWMTGAVATEPAISHGLGGTLLIDCRTRQGMSGAPVFAKRFGEVMLDNGDHVGFEGVAHCFVGLYVGRVHSDADLGTVYRSAPLLALAERGRRGHDCLYRPTESCRPWPANHPA